MHWPLAGIATIGAVEIMLRLPLPATLSGLQSIFRRVVHVISSDNISDHWKEIAVPTYALRLFRLTAKLAFLIAIVVSPFGLAFVASALAGIPLLDFLSSLTGILFSTVIAASYASLRISSDRARL